MKYKAVIADVDGTIIPPSELPAPLASRKLIEKVKSIQNLGVIFTIASGRSLKWVIDLVNSLNIKAPIILDNGARIYDPKTGKNIWESHLEKDVAQNILSFLTKDKSLRIFITDDDNRLDDPGKISKWHTSKILVLGITPQKADELFINIRKIPSVHVTKSISGTNDKNQSIHITNANATKQVAVLKVARHLKIAPEEIIGIGDSYNDFPLLMACGLKVAVDNAVEDIKAIADYIAPAYWEGGVEHVIDKFILNNYE